MGQTVILENGRIIDPVNGVDEEGVELWMRDGRIVAIEDTRPEDCVVHDCSGKWILPGLIDMHVHLREPGEEYKETIASGTRAAAAGGFTGVACMPNTNPLNDNATVTEYILEKARDCDAHVYPVGAISEQFKGEALAEFGEMKVAGAVAFSDDGLPVSDSQLMRRALEYGASHDMLVISHSEESSLSANGFMNEGLTSTRLGLRGIPNAAESIMVHREVALAELTGLPVHIAHVSTAEAVRILRAAKSRGVKVTAETAPHYFTLTDEAVAGYNTNAKMNPPLRSEEDRQQIRKALQDGTLDVIATDHAPHSTLEKELEFDQAANGIIGLETSLPLSMALVREGVLDERRLVEVMSVAPAAILGVPGGSLSVGSPADVTVVDPLKEFVLLEEDLFSKSSNSPFLGRKMQGKAVLTFLGGRVTHRDM